MLELLFGSGSLGLKPFPTFLASRFGEIPSIYKLQHQGLVVNPPMNLSPNFGIEVWWGFHIGTIHQTSALKFGGDSM